MPGLAYMNIPVLFLLFSGIKIDFFSGVDILVLCIKTQRVFQK